MSINNEECYQQIDAMQRKSSLRVSIHLQSELGILLCPSSSLQITFQVGYLTKWCKQREYPHLCINRPDFQVLPLSTLLNGFTAELSRKKENSKKQRRVIQICLNVS